jgi:predicted nucleic acid-binding Zn ribbon protein
MPDPYVVLGVARDASLVDIEAAYVRARSRALADAGSDQRVAEPRLAELDSAWTELNAQPALKATAPVTIKSAHRQLVPVAGQPLAPPSPVARPTRECPYCNLPNPPQVSTCGQCGQQIMRECPACGNPVGIAERVCSRCEVAILDHDQRRFAEALSVQHTVQDERNASDTRVRVLEAGHLARAWQGVLFWIVVGMLVLGAIVGVVGLLGRA